MVKESTQVVKTEKTKVVKRKNLKLPVKSPVKVPNLPTKLPKKEAVNTNVKKKVVKPKQTNVRKINSKPVLAKTTGINISPAKVKNIVSNFVLNKDAYAALKELKDSIPRQITKVVNGKTVTEDFKGVPVAKLSKPTLEYIKHATECYESNLRNEYDKKKVSGMSTADREKYVESRNKSKSEDDEFDLTAFNLSFDKKFYDQYELERKSRETDTSVNEWKKSIDKVTKLKNRFSTNSRVYLSALVEYLIKQLASNGTVCCVADNKKIIQLSHILDTSKEGFEERFPLYPFIVNLDTFKQATKHLNELDAKNLEDSKDSKSSKSNDKTNKNVDLFSIENLSLDKQYQFRYYIGESCREVRMDLAESKTGEDNVYNFTSVSKLFKNFCSTLVCEFLIRIGKMLDKEIETRGIKTVNDTVIKTVISQYHIVCGVSEDKTTEFINNTTKKYYEYVGQRQQKRKDLKKTNDLTYDTK